MWYLPACLFFYRLLQTSCRIQRIYLRHFPTLIFFCYCVWLLTESSSFCIQWFGLSRSSPQQICAIAFWALSLVMFIEVFHIFKVLFFFSTVRIICSCYWCGIFLYYLCTAVQVVMLHTASGVSRRTLTNEDFTTSYSRDLKSTTTTGGCYISVWCSWCLALCHALLW